MNGEAWLATMQRGAGWGLTRVLASSFAGIGARSRIMPPVRLSGARRILIGSGVYVGAGSWLNVVPVPASGATAVSSAEEPVIVIGDGCSLAGTVTLSGVASVVIGRQVLLARGVYIADHAHGMSDVPIVAQPVDRIAPVRVGDGAWLGQNCVIMPGVTIGAGAVVGANSVVTRDVPARCVAVGAPAKVLRELAGEAPA